MTLSLSRAAAAAVLIAAASTASAADVPSPSQFLGFTVGSDRVLADYKPPEMSLYVIYPPTRHLSAKVRVFVDFLVERFSRRPF